MAATFPIRAFSASSAARLLVDEAAVVVAHRLAADLTLNPACLAEVHASLDRAPPVCGVPVLAAKTVLAQVGDRGALAGLRSEL